MEMDEDDSDESQDVDQMELEIALYSQIHFEENVGELLQDEDSQDNGSFNINVEGNTKTGFTADATTAGYLLSKSIHEKYCDVSDTDSIEDPIKNKTVEKEDVMQSVLEVNTDNSQKKHSGIGKNLDKDKEGSVTEQKRPTVGDCESDDGSIYGILGEQADEDEDIHVNVLEDQLPLLKETFSNPTVTTNAAESKDWKINRSDSNLGGGQRSRYYKPIRCLNCNEVGHLSKNCPKPKKQQTCSFCSDTGHVMRTCPQSVCFNCDEPGHDAKNCPYPRRSWYSVCYRCRMKGHDQSHCPDQWRQYHSTIKPGSVKSEKKKITKKIYCYNCSEEAHFGHECEEDRMTRYVRVNTPFICRYQSVKEYEHSGARSDEIEEKKPKKHIRLNDKKLSPFVTLKNKTHEEQSGRNNFDKLQFTVKNEHHKDRNKDISDTVHRVKNVKTKKAKKERNEIKRKETYKSKPEDNNCADIKKRKTKKDSAIKEKAIKEKKRFDSSNNKNIEKDFPRAQKRSMDIPSTSHESKRNKKHRRVNYANYEAENESGFVDNFCPDDLFSLKKIKRIKQTSNEEAIVTDDDLQHQVYNNEWWTGKSGKKSRRRKHKKSKNNNIHLK